MKTFFKTILSVTLIITFSQISIYAQEKSQTQKEPAKSGFDTTKPFMHAKLVGSQNVLEGLVTEDFDRIFQSAHNMKKMSEALQWPRAEDKVYSHYGDEFRLHCDKLMKLSDKKNLEGAHFTYLSMTTTCINCHNYVRGSLRVVRDKTNPQGPVRLIPTEWEGNTYRKNRSANSNSQE